MSDEKMPQYSRKRKAVSKRYKASSSSSSSSSSRILSSNTTWPEVKAVDITLNKTFAAAGQLQLLNGCFRGTDVTEHVGRRVCIKGIGVRGYISVPAGAPTVGGEMLRALIVYDRQPNGAAPAVADILQSAGSGVTTNCAYSNINNTKRFVVLAKKTWYLSQSMFGAAAGTISIVDTMDKTWDCWVSKKKVKNLVCEFNAGSTGGVSDISTGSILLLTIGTSGNCTFQGECRYRFCDV